MEAVEESIANTAQNDSIAGYKRTNCNTTNMQSIIGASTGGCCNQTLSLHPFSSAAKKHVRDVHQKVVSHILSMAFK